MALVVARPKRSLYQVDDLCTDDLFSSSPPGTSALGLRWVRHQQNFITRLERIAFQENPIWWNDIAVLKLSSFLNFNEFNKFAQVNKLAVRLSKTEILWERHLLIFFGCLRTEIVKPTPESSRELFKFLFTNMGLMYKNSAREASLHDRRHVITLAGH